MHDNHRRPCNYDGVMLVPSAVRNNASGGGEEGENTGE
jgi:hypothetical protein